MINASSIERRALAAFAVISLAAAFFPSDVFAQTQLPGYFDEISGRIIIEAESIGSLPSRWEDQVSTNAPNIKDPGLATGDGFIVWDGSQQLNNPGNGLMVYPIRINTPGEYRFCWRSQVGSGNSATEHNDSWLKIESSEFFGRNGSGGIVCPKGLTAAENACTGNAPNGSGRDGWFKVYSSGTTSWTFSTRTSDNDAHNIFAQFDAAGLYAIKVSARSSFHLLDRFTLSKSGDCETDLGLSESVFVDIELIFDDRFES